MVSLPSGSVNKEVELVLIETNYLSLVIKGKPFHQRYEGLKQYRTMDFHDEMEFDVFGEAVGVVKVFDVEKQSLQPYSKQRPIFFENSSYQLIISPKGKPNLTFYHEHLSLRNSISRVEIGGNYLLMGTLNFRSEVGLSTFEIRSDETVILTVTMEVYPSKLDYKRDYKQLIDEVNDEIYNLSYHFLKKTYLGAQIKLDGRPSLAEFFRLMTFHFESYVKAIERIEKQPHHKLEKSYKKVRADKIKRLDSSGRSYFRKNPSIFVPSEKGIELKNQTIIPLKGLNAQKHVIYDTAENRTIKWMTNCLIEKLDGLLSKLKSYGWRQVDRNEHLENEIEGMTKVLRTKLTNNFWRAIKGATQQNISLVMQMAPGYRDAFQIYLTVSKGLALQGKLYQMSVKDVAELYEYWTFLKMGQILTSKYKQVNQDIIKVNRDGLFINLDTKQSAKRIFEHPYTKERITLTYQKTERNPTTTQKPDTLLTIEKKGKDYQFNYIFDAKYRVDFALEESYYQRRYQSPGPLEEDINTMHRYRDSIVARTNGPYERTAFGAYVLFPFGSEDAYTEHPFYKSINEVNIGGLPFLPSATSLVEQLIHHLIEKSPEEIQEKGVLPIGTKDEWRAAVEESVLVGVVSTEEHYVYCKQNVSLIIPMNQLRKSWQQSKYLALYVSQTANRENGVVCYGLISDVNVIQNEVRFVVDSWINLKQVIKPVNYGIAGSMITTLSQLKEATELPELFMKTKEETLVWRMLRRVSDRIKVELDSNELDRANSIEAFHFKDITVEVLKEENRLCFKKDKHHKEIALSELQETPSKVFRLMVDFMELG
ncbi:DUF2357 domain-containing protein [Alkalihalobacillus sp. 1P02AB]|uniref:DUF2357 domain-containing protein n=1 Tax=Alkalihalobacillus sp. 1P02AB TaxID=3132260 RepID=UPI0039A64D6C